MILKMRSTGPPESPRSFWGDAKSKLLRSERGTGGRRGKKGGEKVEHEGEERRRRNRRRKMLFCCVVAYTE